MAYNLTQNDCKTALAAQRVAFQEEFYCTEFKHLCQPEVPYSGGKFLIIDESLPSTAIRGYCENTAGFHFMDGSFIRGTMLTPSEHVSI